MKSKISKKIILASTLCLIINFCFALPVLADDPPPGGSDAIIDGIEKTATHADMTDAPTDLNLIAGGIINYSFGIVAIVFVSVIAIGGYFLMAAGGNDENVAKAKAFIINGLSGLIVIMVAYGLVWVIMFSLNNAIN